MENKNESKKRIIRGISGTLAGIVAGIMVGLTPNAQLVSYANQNRVQDENNKVTDMEKKDIEHIIDEELGIGNDISKEDRQLLIEKYEKSIYKYIYYQEAKQKLENANTLKLTDEQIEVAAKAYVYLKSEGVKDEQNIGTLVDMLFLSGLNPNAVSRDAFKFFGVMQWSYSLKEDYVKFLEKYNTENGTDYKFDDIEPQMAYYLKGSYDIFVKKGKSTVNIYNEQEFESGAKAATYLLKEYIRLDPKLIDYERIEVVANAFEEAFEGRKTIAFKNAFGKKKTIEPKKLNVGEIFKKGIDR